MSSKFARLLRKENNSHGYYTKKPVVSAADAGVIRRPTMGEQGALIFLTQQAKRLTMTNIYSLIKSTPSLD